MFWFKKIVFLTVLIFYRAIIQPLFAEPSIQSYLPDCEVLDQLEQVGTPLSAKGHVLFSLINGEAEIYHEYGFSEAIIASYKMGSSKFFDLQIYRMKDSVSAYGIYSFKTGNSGNKLKLGNEGLFEHYYLTFWKGDYQVSVSGGSPYPELETELLAIATNVADKIHAVGDPPKLIKLFSNQSSAMKPVKYLKGHLGLSVFGKVLSYAVSGFEEGVFKEVDGLKTYVFRYQSQKKAGKHFIKSHVFFESNLLPKDISKTQNTFTSKLSDRSKIRIEIDGVYILSVDGNNLSKAKEIIKQLKKKLKTIQL